MANFKIGDKVKILSNDVKDKTGVIVDKGTTGTVTTSKNRGDSESTETKLLTWWKVVRQISLNNS